MDRWIKFQKFRSLDPVLLVEKILSDLFPSQAKRKPSFSASHSFSFPLHTTSDDQKRRRAADTCGRGRTDSEESKQRRPLIAWSTTIWGVEAIISFVDHMEESCMHARRSSQIAQRIYTVVGVVSAGSGSIQIRNQEHIVYRPSGLTICEKIALVSPVFSFVVVLLLLLVLDSSPKSLSLPRLRLL